MSREFFLNLEKRASESCLAKPFLKSKQRGFFPKFFSIRIYCLFTDQGKFGFIANLTAFVRNNIHTDIK